MSERTPSVITAQQNLDNFDANKAAYEQQQYWDELQTVKEHDENGEVVATNGIAGRSNFSEEARTQLEEVSAYDAHLKKMQELGENYGTDVSAIENETAHADEAIANDPYLRRMNMIAKEVAKLREEDGDKEKIQEKEDNLSHLLETYSETTNPSQIAIDRIVSNTVNETSVADDESLIINVPAESKTSEQTRTAEELHDDKFNEAYAAVNSDTAPQAPEAPTTPSAEVTSSPEEKTQAQKVQEAYEQAHEAVAEAAKSTPEAPAPTDAAEAAAVDARAAEAAEILNGAPIQDQDDIDRFDRTAGNAPSETEATDTQPQAKKRSRLMRLLRAPIFDAEKIAATNAKRSERATKSLAKDASKRQERKDRDQILADLGQKPTLLNKAKFFFGFEIKAAPKHVNGSVEGYSEGRDLEGSADTAPTEVIAKEDELVDSNR